MTNEHLSETEIQEYVLDKTNAPENIIEHVALCESCKIKVENYKILFAGISQQPASSFNFNLSGLVMAQLPQPKTKVLPERFVIYLLSFIAIAIIGFLGYVFRKNIENIFAGISFLFMIIIIIASFIIIVFKSIEIYKKYQQKINLLNFS
jgi:amino acid transporter